MMGLDPDEPYIGNDCQLAAEDTAGWRDVPRSIRDCIASCVDKCRYALSTSFRGAYLHGSVAHGHYNAETSDVDMLIVSQCLVPLELRREVSLIFKRSSTRLLGKGLEASLVPLSSATGDDDPPCSLSHFSITNAMVSERRAGEADSDLVLHFVDVRARGIVLAGTEVESTFAPVTFVAFVDSLLRDYDWMTSPQRLDADPIYAVFNMCRLLVVAATQRVAAVSKIEAALTALTMIDDRYRPLVQAALASYSSPRTNASKIILNRTTLHAFKEITDSAADVLRTPQVAARRAAYSI